jgi:hypothetical protein
MTPVRELSSAEREALDEAWRHRLRTTTACESARDFGAGWRAAIAYAEQQRREADGLRLRQAERVDEVYGRRSQMEVYRLHPPSSETEGFATWSGDTVLGEDDRPILAVPYAQFAEALDILRASAPESRAADDFVFRMDVNHIRSNTAERRHVEQQVGGDRAAIEQEFENEAVRRMQHSGQCPTCGAEQ